MTNLPDTLKDGRVIVSPVTGEAIDLGAHANDLAHAIDHVRDLEAQLRNVKRQIADELIARMDRAAAWTLTADDWKISAPSPSRLEYDAEKLATVLTRLVADGRLDPDAARRAIVLEPKVKRAGLEAIRRLGGEVRDEVDACGSVSDAPRNVTLKRRDRA